MSPGPVSESGELAAEETRLDVDRRSPGVASLVACPEEFARADDPAGRPQRERFELRRRGRWHGWLAELEPERSGAPRDLAPAWARRWHAARPIVLPGVLDPRAALVEGLAPRQRLHAEIAEPGGLLAYLLTRREALEPRFSLHGHAPPGREDPLRIERVRCTWSADCSRRGPIMRDLWIESARPAEHEDDESLCLRIGFGNGERSSNRIELARARRACELAELVLPEVASLQSGDDLAGWVQILTAEEVLFTRHAAHWIGREGGAGFREDIFPEDLLGRELGACWVQLDGRTLWIALSAEDLGQCVIEFGQRIACPGEAWLLEQLFPKAAERERFLHDLEHPERIRSEVARPGCGALRRLVDRGPEFTAWLADSGHAYLLHPGDALLLPRHGVERAAASACFGVDELPAYGLWTSIESIRPGLDGAEA